MIDLKIDKLNEGNVDYTNNAQQKAEIWVRVNNQQVFSEFGVRYQELLFGELQLNDINPNTLIHKITLDLNKEGIATDTNVIFDDMGSIIINIKVLN